MHSQKIKIDFCEEILRTILRVFCKHVDYAQGDQSTFHDNA